MIQRAFSSKKLEQTCSNSNYPIERNNNSHSCHYSNNTHVPIIIFEISSLLDSCCYIFVSIFFFFLSERTYSSVPITDHIFCTRKRLLLISNFWNSNFGMISAHCHSFFRCQFAEYTLLSSFSASTVVSYEGTYEVLFSLLFENFP